MKALILNSIPISRTHSASLPYLISIRLKCVIRSLQTQAVGFLVGYGLRPPTVGLITNRMTRSVCVEVPVCVCVSSCQCAVGLDLIMVWDLIGLHKVEGYVMQHALHLC